MTTLTTGTAFSGLNASITHQKATVSNTYQKATAEIHLDYDSINQKFDSDVVALINEIPSFVISVGLSDAINLSDATGIIRILGLTPKDTIILTDNTSTVDISADVYFRNFTDSIVVKDPVATEQNLDAIINQTPLNEYLLGWDGSQEGASKYITAQSTPLDATIDLTAITDTQAITINPAVSDTLPIVDTLSSTVVYNRNYGETQVLSDLATITLGSVLNDTATITDVPTVFIESAGLMNGAPLNTILLN